jgi:predicted AlkP superfamily phosphohydrolase/phosphomutase
MRRPLQALLVTLLAVMTLWPAVSLATAAKPAEGRVIVLGFDGGDYRTAAELAAAGRMPNLAELAEEGTFAPLGTTWSAESPVAWAALNTGQNPSKTGVPGFVKRTLMDGATEVESGGTPSPAVGHQTNETRAVKDMDAGFLIGTLASFSSLALSGLVLVIVMLAFLVVFKGLLRLKTGLSVVMSLALGLIGALGAREAKSYVPDTIPGVVGNPVEVDNFWEIAAAKGSKAVVLDAAMAWDRPAVDGAQVLGGLGLPDCRGENGQWFVYTNDELEVDRAPAGRTKGLTAGTVFRIDDWRDDKITSAIYGPSNFHELSKLEAEVASIDEQLAPENDVGWQEGNRLRERKKDLKSLLSEGARATSPMEFERKGEVVTLSIGGQAQDLREGVWSDWYHIAFELNPLLKAHAVTRVKILSLDDPFTLFVNTLDIDPSNPQFWQPVSQPRDFSVELASRTGGVFETFGWACATMAFKDKLIDPVTMLEDIEFTMKWREKLTKDALERGDWDVLMTVFSTPDRVQHMCYQYYDPAHPKYDAEAASQKMTFFGKEIELREAVPVIYEQVDRIIGYVREALDPEDTLLVCADHGFQSFRHQVDLNTWLAQNGYLKLNSGVTRTSNNSFLTFVDWKETRAYALGLGMIYLNLEGRESGGIVKASEARALLDEIRDGLMALEDTREGQSAKVVETVTYIDDVHDGPYRYREGDLMVGFKPTYRVSWGTTTGGIRLVKDDAGAVVPGEVFQPNLNNWSGGHVSVAPEHVAGIFASNRKVTLPEEGAHLLHIAPTTLRLLGVDAPVASDKGALEIQH